MSECRIAHKFHEKPECAVSEREIPSRAVARDDSIVSSLFSPLRVAWASIGRTSVFRPLISASELVERRGSIPPIAGGRMSSRCAD